MPQPRSVRNLALHVYSAAVYRQRVASLTLPPRTMLCSRGALVILCTALLFCNACATQVLHQAGGIDPGATRAQVREILGNPQDRQFRGSQEAWQYCQTGLVNDTFVVVWFVDGTVTGMTSYKDSVGDIGLCSSHFKSIRWEDAPTVTIEMRQR